VLGFWAFYQVGLLHCTQMIHNVDQDKRRMRDRPQCTRAFVQGYTVWETHCASWIWVTKL